MSAKKSKSVSVKDTSIASAVKGNNNEERFFFSKLNYQLMGVGVLLVVIGFLLMVGAKVSDHNVFDAAEIYSFRRITLAPILIILGFVVEVFAIMKRFKK